LQGGQSGTRLASEGRATAIAADASDEHLVASDEHLVASAERFVASAGHVVASAEPFVVSTDTVAPMAEPFGPRFDTIVPTAEPLGPRFDTVVPRAEPLGPRFDLESRSPPSCEATTPSVSPAAGAVHPSFGGRASSRGGLVQELRRAAQPAGDLPVDAGGAVFAEQVRSRVVPVRPTRVEVCALGPPICADGTPLVF
jgi:hypothetical protein